MPCEGGIVIQSYDSHTNCDHISGRERGKRGGLPGHDVIRNHSHNGGSTLFSLDMPSAKTKHAKHAETGHALAGQRHTDPETRRIRKRRTRRGQNCRGVNSTLTARLRLTPTDERVMCHLFGPHQSRGQVLYLYDRSEWSMNSIRLRLCLSLPV
jgi:hypothetical protein